MNAEQVHAEPINTKKDTGEMQTVVSNYVTPNLITQADRLIVSHNYPSDSYTEYYGEDVDRLSFDARDEREHRDENINVDEDEKEDELVIADDVTEDSNQCQDESTGHDTNNVNINQLDRGAEDSTVQIQDNCNINSDREESGEPSWHPHVYGKPPKKPTPHTIEYILGLSKVGEVKEQKRSTVSQLMNVKRNFANKKTFAYKEKSTQVPRDVPERKVSLSAHKNKLQEQLLQRGVRTSDSDYDKVFAFKTDDQPLNLSVPKAKDSPAWSPGGDEDKFNK
ncbi:jg14458, partial [Pararge aegeria aegeria]